VANVGDAGPERLTSALRDAALRWIADDPSPRDRAELQQVLADAMGGNASALADLADRMRAPLAFGTAGLRGPLRAGPAGMNLAVVRRAAAGIAAHLLANGGPRRVVVVGHDARHRSREFAQDAANVFSAAGFRVLLAAEPLPTPITAFAVRRLNAAAGVQVTASHNPPQDNGLKVYLHGGSQIVAPTDAAIEAAIAAVPAAVSVDTSGTPESWPAEGPDAIVEPYLARVASLAVGAAKDLRIVATALHGVGARTLVEALRRAGFTDVQMVAAQERPDPDFPTVNFPNPEEPGATDLLLELAERMDADLAIANDPDADRCSIGARAADGSWRMLRGDETGALLGDHLLSGLNRAIHPDPLVATTIVSSALLESIAAARRVRFDLTLTGFKWIVRAGDGQGAGLVYGYEEALGICVDPDHVRDKDGISAAVVAADLAAALKARDRTLFDALDDLARGHGLYLTDQLSIRVDHLTEISTVMHRLRSSLPTTLLDSPVTSSEDLLPRTDAVILRTASTRVVVRPSGTEPKIKCYLEVVAPVHAQATDLTDARAAATGSLARLRAEIAEVLGVAR